MPAQAGIRRLVSVMPAAAGVPCFVALCAALCAHAPAALAQSSALGGGTGLLTVPDAHVRAEGTAEFAYSRHYPDLDVTLESDTYYAGIGLAPGLEIGGRAIAGALRSGRRDLSVDVKYRLPWQAGPLAVALGAQDLGGTFRLVRRYYGVGTLAWRDVTLTAGVGDARNVMNGVFGGIAWRPWSWLDLLVEHDADAWNGGLKLRTPAVAGWRAGLTGVWRGALDEAELGAQVEFPLGRRWGPHESGAGHEPAALQPAGVRAAGTGGDLRKRLVALGFEAVRIGRRGDTLVVQLENRRYNHSALDGIGVALGTIAALGDASARAIELHVHAYGVPQLRVRAAMDAPWDTQAEFVDTLEDAAAVTWRDAAPTAASALELVFEPVLRTFVATESGLVDYALAARARLTAPLGGGLLLNVGVQAPLARSEDFDAGRAFGTVAPRAGVDLAVAQYLHTPAPGWTWLWSAGHVRLYRADFSVGALEQVWSLGGGRHRWRTKLMALHGDARSRHVALGGYTWYDAHRDYAVALTGGRFYAGDAGARVDVSRWFGDTQVGLLFKAASRDDQMIGAFLSLPLTPRRDAYPSFVQVKGSRRWGHGLSTTLNAPDGTAGLRPLLLYEPTLDLDLARDVLDSGRLGADDLRAHSARLQDAYVELGGAAGR